MRSAFAAAAAVAAALTLAAQTAVPQGVQDPVWAPDGRHLAVSFFDRIWITGPDGRGGRPLRAAATATERDPAWSPDGRLVVFAADDGDGFDLFVAGAEGRDLRQITQSNGDERWPSFTRDGRIVFARRDGTFEPWRLHIVAAAGGEPAALFADAPADTEREPRVSPDGKRVAYVSDRESDDGDVDLWIADLPAATGGRAARTRVTTGRGREGFPSWAPDGSRIAYFAQREGYRLHLGQRG